MVVDDLEHLRAETRAPTLTPAGFQILLALLDRERHGYDIMLSVARDSDGAVRLGPTTLYRNIRSLLSAGLIEESVERPDPDFDDERRRYYRLTPAGGGAAGEWLAEARRTNQMTRSDLSRWLAALFVTVAVRVPPGVGSPGAAPPRRQLRAR